MATHFTRIGSPYRPHTIYEKITHEMAPSGSLIAYFIDKNGEIIADIIRFTVEVQFQNSVCIFFCLDYCFFYSACFQKKLIV